MADGPEKTGAGSPWVIDRATLAEEALEECARIFGACEEHAIAQISAATRDIKTREAELRDEDRKLLVRSIRTQIAAVLVGVAAAIVTTALTVAGLGLASAVTGLAMALFVAVLLVDSPIRTAYWLKKRDGHERELTAANEQLEKWVTEKDSVGQALRGIERALDPILPGQPDVPRIGLAMEQKQLGTATEQKQLGQGPKQVTSPTTGTRKPRAPKQGKKGG